MEATPPRATFWSSCALCVQVYPSGGFRTLRFVAQATIVRTGFLPPCWKDSPHKGAFKTPPYVAVVSLSSPMWERWAIFTRVYQNVNHREYKDSSILQRVGNPPLRLMWRLRHHEHQKQDRLSQACRLLRLPPMHISYRFRCDYIDFDTPSKKIGMRHRGHPYFLVQLQLPLLLF